MYPSIEPKNGENGTNVYLFLFDREYDLVTPLVNDFYYENLLLDFLQLDFNHILIKGKNYVIDSNDKVYSKYAY